MLFICSIWGAVANSYNSLLGSQIVGAFAGGTTEALGAAIVNVSLFVIDMCIETSEF